MVYMAITTRRCTNNKIIALQTCRCVVLCEGGQEENGSSEDIIEDQVDKVWTLI